MPLTRLYTFVTGNTIDADEHNDELNQLINLLNGTEINNVILRHNSGGTATLLVDHTGGGPALEVHIGGVLAAKVNGNRQLELSPLGGQAPIVLPLGASKVQYLDADKLDGVEGANYVRKDQSSTIEGSPGTYLGLKENVTSHEVRLSTTGSQFRMVQADTTEEFFTYVFASKEIVASQGGNDDPANARGLVTRTYVEGRTSPWIAGVFFEGVVSTATVQPVYVVPDSSIKPKTLKVTYRSGTPTAGSVFRISRYNSTGTLYGAPSQWSITLPMATAVDNVVSFTIPDTVTFLAGDQIVFECTTAGDHADVSFYVVGTEGLT